MELCGEGRAKKNLEDQGGTLTKFLFELKI